MSKLPDTRKPDPATHGDTTTHNRLFAVCSASCSGLCCILHWHSIGLALCDEDGPCACMDALTSLSMVGSMRGVWWRRCAL